MNQRDNIKELGVRASREDEDRLATLHCWKNPSSENTHICFSLSWFTNSNTLNDQNNIQDAYDANEHFHNWRLNLHNW